MSQNKHRYNVTALTVIAAIFSLIACGTPGATKGGITPTRSAALATVARTQSAAALNTATSPPRTASALPATQTRTRPISVATTIPSSDFAFTFDAGWCGIGKLDVFDGTFTTKIRTDEPDRTVNLVLSQTELATIYRTMIGINFFDYPEHYKTVIPSGSPAMVHIPAITYRLSVRDGGRMKSVVWTDEISGPTTVETDNLRTLIQLIEQTITNRPEYKNLPPRRFGCA